MNRVYVAVILIFLVTIGCALSHYHPPQEQIEFIPAFGTTPPGGGGSGDSGDDGAAGGSGDGGSGDGGSGDGEGGDGDGEGDGEGPV